MRRLRFNGEEMPEWLDQKLKLMSPSPDTNTLLKLLLEDYIERNKPEQVLVENLVEKDIVGKIVFKDGNDIRFSQDFGQKSGLPSDRVFAVEPRHVLSNAEDIWLHAIGYGQSGSYGNGKIVIRKEELENKKNQWVKID
jgi:hypothetical protein